VSSISNFHMKALINLGTARRASVNRLNRRADRSQTEQLIKGIDADHLLADKGYDRAKLIEKAKEGGMTPVIPSRRSRINDSGYGK